MKNALLAVLLASTPAGAADSFGAGEAGTSAAAFLKLAADARAAGMGQAVSAAVDDASAAFWNPAGLARLRFRHAALSHAGSGRSWSNDSFAYAHPVRSPRPRSPRERDLETDQLGGLAVALLSHTSGRLREVDNAGNETGDSLAPRDLAATLAWGASVWRGLDVGLSLKYISSKIQAEAAAGAVDFGARWRTTVSDTEAAYALAVVIRNAGGRLKFREASDPLPLAAVVGQALAPVRSLTLTADLVAPRDRSAYASFGAEWKAPSALGMTACLRAGYDGRLTSKEVSGVTTTTLGGGVDFERLGFDYAWTPAGELGDLHRVSLSYRF